MTVAGLELIEFGENDQCGCRYIEPGFKKVVTRSLLMPGERASVVVLFTEAKNVTPNAGHRIAVPGNFVRLAALD